MLTINSILLSNTWTTAVDGFSQKNWIKISRKMGEISWSPKSFNSLQPSSPPRTGFFNYHTEQSHWNPHSTVVSGCQLYSMVINNARFWSTEVMEPNWSYLLGLLYYEPLQMNKWIANLLGTLLHKFVIQNSMQWFCQIVHNIVAQLMVSIACVVLVSKSIKYGAT